jgi:hypothetical protein
VKRDVAAALPYNITRTRAAAGYQSGAWQCNFALPRRGSLADGLTPASILPIFYRTVDPAGPKLSTFFYTYRTHLKAQRTSSIHLQLIAPTFCLLDSRYV